MALGTLLAFIGMMAAPIATYAGVTPVEIKVRVTEKGFLDEKGKPYNAKNVLRIPNGTPVTLTFVFSEEMTSLAVGDTHQITLKSDKGVIGETEKIWIMSRQASVTFHAGEQGQTRYRAYCVLDCIGMEHLTNLLIEVV
jgi:hypothetical protein